MQGSFLHILAVIAAVGTAASIVYCVLAIVGALRFTRRQHSAVDATRPLPAISILKPLKGADPTLYEALRSHCTQDYPAYEILFGVPDAGDPSVAVVEKLARELPNCSMRLVVCDKRLGANGKVSSLVQLAAEAKHEFWLVNDSDICIEPDYLRTVVTELQPQRVGMVTCLYRGVPGVSLFSRLESLGISTDFAAGVLSAWLIEGGLHFSLGSTMVLRKADLNAIGGFEALVDYLADDYELGKKIAEKKDVTLSKTIVETHLPAYDWGGFFSHQLRWARTIRTSRFGGYIGLLLTFTIPWGIGLIAFSRGAAWAWAFGVAAFVMRCFMAVVITRVVLRDSHSLRSLWLLPLRDVIAVAVWLGGLFGRKIIWRGETFLLRGGKLMRVAR